MDTAFETRALCRLSRRPGNKMDMDAPFRRGFPCKGGAGKALLIVRGGLRLPARKSCRWI